MSETEDSEALSRGKRSPKTVVSALTSTPTGSGKKSAVVGAPCALVAALPADTLGSVQTCPLRAFFFPQGSNVRVYVCQWSSSTFKERQREGEIAGFMYVICERVCVCSCVYVYVRMYV